MRGVTAIAAALLASPAALAVWACSSGASQGASADDAGLTVPAPDSGDEQVLRGWSAVNARGCPECHEPPDASDGILSGQTTLSPGTAPGTTAYGTNLTPDPDTGLDAWDAATIARAIRQGYGDQGQRLCSPMPRFIDMHDDEAYAIAAYLQSLVAVHRDIPPSVCGTAEDDGGDAGSDAPDDTGG
jgi:hypothetical protein